VQYLAFIICVFLILSALPYSAMADEKDTRGNASPMIFNFSAASPVKESHVNFTLNKTGIYSKNESVEAYYNNLSLEADTSLPENVFLGIPMQCHFCLAFSVIKTAW